MTQSGIIERIRPFLVELESRVERRVPGSSGGISDGSVRHHGDDWSQLTLEFIASGGADLFWAMVYVRVEESVVHALAEFGREDRVLGEFVAPPSPPGSPADDVGAFLLALEDRFVLELAGPGR